MERGHGEDSQDRDRAGYSRYFWRSASDGDRQSHVAAAPERFGEEIVGRAAQARPVLHESDFRGGHRARVRGEDSSSKTDPAEAAANGGQDCMELGPTPVGAGMGFPSGSHSAHAGHDRNLSTKRIVRASVEGL